MPFFRKRTNPLMDDLLYTEGALSILEEKVPALKEDGYTDEEIKELRTMVKGCENIIKFIKKYSEIPPYKKRLSEDMLAYTLSAGRSAGKIYEICRRLANNADTDDALPHMDGKYKADLHPHGTFTFKQEDKWLHITYSDELPNPRISSKELFAYKREMEDFVREEIERQESEHLNIHQMKNVYMIFLHNQNRSRHIFRDADNYYEKALSDIITDYFIAGTDTSTNVQFMSLAKDSPKAYTEVFLVPFDSITDWFTVYNNVIHEGL